MPHQKRGRKRPSKPYRKSSNGSETEPLCASAKPRQCRLKPSRQAVFHLILHSGSAVFHEDASLKFSARNLQEKQRSHNILLPKSKKLAAWRRLWMRNMHLIRNTRQKLE